MNAVPLRLPIVPRRAASVLALLTVGLSTCLSPAWAQPAPSPASATPTASAASATAAAGAASAATSSPTRTARKATAKAAGTAASAPRRRAPEDGVPVKVTPDMTGAGIVSSGVALPPIPPVTGSREKPVASWGKPLPYPIIVADRRNNRLIEIAPDKRIVWEMPSPDLSYYRGNEDVNFSHDGKRLAVSEEDNYDLHIVDYETKTVTWTWGIPDHRGKAGRLLNYPDDSHLLDDGQFLTADIRNCRVLIINPETNQITTTWGAPGQCEHAPPGKLAFPNGATPMGPDILVSEISGSWISRITRAGQVLWSVKAPKVRYPSDAFPTNDGKQVIVADFAKPGRIVIFDPATGKPTWEYFVERGEWALDHPSIARELPGTGDVLVVDDLRDRVLVLDRQTKQVIWQYGVTDTKGFEPGYFNYPDGVDIDVFRDWRPAAKAGTAAR